MNITKTERYRAIGWDEVRRRGLAPPSVAADLDLVAAVFPFRTNDYVLENLIDWSQVPADPMFQLTFPQIGMLSGDALARLRAARDDPAALRRTVRGVREELNPHPDGQLHLNVPQAQGERVPGVQHKYRETVLVFPSAGQTCHAYCAYCFRWPQFTGEPAWRFTTDPANSWIGYVAAHPDVTDVLFTGGDPLMMSTARLRTYIEPILTSPELAHVRSIRIGTKALAYWPARFTEGADADDLLRLFEEVVAQGRQLAVMGHYSHPVELESPLATAAVRRVRATGAVVRSQAPLVARVNDDAAVWSRMWKRQITLGVQPYYMFIARQTGAQRHFAVPMLRAVSIYNQALAQVSGLARTARGPVMSTTGGKVLVEGTVDLDGRQVVVLKAIQARNPALVGAIALAEADAHSEWLNDLKLVSDPSGLLDFM